MNINSPFTPHMSTHAAPQAPSTSRSSRFSLRSKSRPIVLSLLALPLVLGAPDAVQARKKTKAPVVAPLVLPHGKRVLFLLPLQLGVGWNANSVFTREFVPKASRAMKDAFRATGRYSLVEANRSDPIVQRGLIDDMFSAEEYEALLTTPTIESANAIVSKLTFDQTPKLGFSDQPQIVQIVMDRFPAQTGKPSVQIVARLYDFGLTTPTRTLTVIAGLQNVNGLAPAALTLASTTAGFKRLAQELAKPQAEAELPFLPSPVLPAAPAAAAEGTTGSTTEAATDAPAADVPKEDAPADPGGADNPAK